MVECMPTEDCKESPGFAKAKKRFSVRNYNRQDTLFPTLLSSSKTIREGKKGRTPSTYAAFQQYRHLPGRAAASAVLNLWALQPCCAMQECLKGSTATDTVSHAHPCGNQHSQVRNRLSLVKTSAKALSAKPHLRSPHTCWLAGSCLFQVVEGLVEVAQVVKRHSRSVERLEVLAFLLKHLEAVFLDPLVIHQLGLEQAGCGARGWRGDRQTGER